MNFLRAWCLIAELVVSVDLVKLADLLAERTKKVDWLEELVKLVDLLEKLPKLMDLLKERAKLVDFEANIAALGGCLLVFLSPVGRTVETSEFHNRTRYFEFFHLLVFETLCVGGYSWTDQIS